MKDQKSDYPFIATVGQEKMKEALILNLINSSIGGVLIRGEKGTAKSTLVRALGELFPEQKFMNMPLHITEDNLLGNLDIEKTIKFGRKIFQEGFLQKVHGGILYIDEINLLGESILAIPFGSAFQRKMLYREGRFRSFL
ncbi:MAG TPA: AAA family ATPase [Fusobacterium sp.]|uniref:AAA family ATPase n=1 Tax=Fusobacterium sp. TaxID=68766 RepID=UPI002F41B279